MIIGTGLSVPDQAPKNLSAGSANRWRRWIEIKIGRIWSLK